MPVNMTELGPIRDVPVNGPALDEWNSRKEDNNNRAASTRDFRSNFEVLQQDLRTDLAGIVSQP